MGFNLSGFVIKTPVQDKQVFEQSLNLELKDAGPTFLEDATLNKYGSPYFDIYKTDKGTIVFCDDPYFDNNAGLAALSMKADVMTFSMSETAMAFDFKKFSNGTLQWEEGVLFEETIKRMGDNHLQITDNTDVVFDTFAKITTEYLGISIHQVDLAEEVKRYLATKLAPASSINTDTETFKPSDVFWAFWEFTGEIYKKNKKTIIKETNDRRFFSFESYLRSKVAPELVEPYCKYMSEHMNDYQAWQKQKVDEVSQSKTGKKKRGAETVFKIASFVIIVFSCIYGLIGLLLKPFGVTIWSWSAYLSAFAGIILLVVLWIIFKVVMSLGAKRKTSTVVCFDREVPL